MKKSRGRVRQFFYIHDTLAVALMFSIIIVTVFAIMFAIMWGLGYPKCYQQAQAYTGEFNYSVITGCFIKLSDGKFYFADNIRVISTSTGVQITIEGK